MEIVDLGYYLEEYLTNVDDGIPERQFAKYEKRARQYLSSFTFNRLENMEFTESIKNCICEMAEDIYIFDNKKTGNGIVSESTDGHSVTFEKHSVGDLDKELYSIAVRYLAFTGLLYSGVYQC